MWSEKLLIISIVTCCFGINLGREFQNSTAVISESNDNFSNSTYFNYDGNIHRIVGGKPINIAQVPYQVALYRNGYLTCGGSIISADWVLTAAHCVKDGGSFAVRAGSRYYRRGGQIRFARIVVISGGFNSNTLLHDIALIRVFQRFRWTRKVQPIRLAKPRWQLPSKYVVSGWGTRHENSNKAAYGLRAVVVKNIPRKTCKAMYKKYHTRITKTDICASSPGKDSCQGDSGGPLAFHRIQYGIVSFGIGCARSGNPGVYTSVRREYSWIRKVIRRRGGQMPNQRIN